MNQAPEADTGILDLNTRQRRFIDFAVRKSCRWEVAPDDPTIVVITRGGSNRQMVLYRSGRSGTGMRVAIIDPSAPAARGLRWITQDAAWTLLAYGAL